MYVEHELLALEITPGACFPSNTGPPSNLHWPPSGKIPFQLTDCLEYFDPFRNAATLDEVQDFLETSTAKYGAEVLTRTYRYMECSLTDQYDRSSRKHIVQRHYTLPENLWSFLGYRKTKFVPASLSRREQEEIERQVLPYPSYMTEPLKYEYLRPN